MKKILKNKWLWVIIIIAIIGGAFAYYKISGSKPAIQYTTEDVTRGNLIQTVTATGEVDSAHDINLSFRQSGRLAELNVEEGNLVKAGQILAKINSSAIQAQIDQAQANVRAAQANLEQIKAGASAEDINVSQAQVQKAQSDLTNLQSQRDEQVAALRAKTIDSLNNLSYTAQTALDKINNYFINSETTHNLQFNNISLQNQVNSDYQVMLQRLSDLKKSINSINQSVTEGQILSLAADSLNFLSDLNAFLDNSFNLANSIIVNSNYPQTTKDSIKADISVQQTNNTASINALQVSRSNLSGSIVDFISQIDAAQKNLAIYQAQLALKQAGPRSFQINSANAALSQAQAQLEQLTVSLADYQISAPIDGKITKINFKVGEQPNLTDPVIQMHGVDRFEIKVEIAESDITKIKVGNKVTIELDAFGSDHLFSGTVSFIQPAQTIIKDVVYYETTVIFDKDSWSDQIKPGMTANITAITAEKDNVLYIPQRAVKIKETVLGEVANKYVDILVNGQAQERPVTIGLRGDNGLVEVLAGLAEGDKVITFQK